MITALILVLLLPILIVFRVFGVVLHLALVLLFPVLAGLGAHWAFSDTGIYPAPTTYTIIMLIVYVTGGLGLLHWYHHTRGGLGFHQRRLSTPRRRRSPSRRRY